jgi:hypothetical protein
MDEPTIVRRALDELLARYPSFDLVNVDWQLAIEGEGEEIRPYIGPWFLVTLGQPSERYEGGVPPPPWVRHHFAIWKTTGAVHGVQHDGSVTDDPLW